jgi:neutral ceramidase
MLEAGAGQADITPDLGSPLSGFIARENRPSTGLDTPLFVRALALRHQNTAYFLFSFDLLGIDAPLAEQMTAGLQNVLGPTFARERCILTAVHNHSGPPTGLLLGEAPSDSDYLDRLVAQTVSAAQQALAALRPAELIMAERRLPDLTYNRRAILPDGRVSISLDPDLPVLQRGPLDDRLTILLFRDLAGRSLVSIAHFACHGVAVLSQNIGADIPGALSSKIEALLGVPCLFLQGAAGDTNPTTVTATYQDLLSWIEQARPHLEHLESSFCSVEIAPLHAVHHQLVLEFAPLPAPELASREADALERIAGGDTSSPDLHDAINSIKNTMNLLPGEPLASEKCRFVAQVLAGHARRVEIAARQSSRLPPLTLPLSAWRLGNLGLVFIPAEIFTSTGQKICSLSSNLSVLPVTYRSSLAGYLPEQDALSKGGYEVNDAWRFYGKLAPFAHDSEARLLDAVDLLIQDMEVI